MWSNTACITELDEHKEQCNPRLAFNYCMPENIGCPVCMQRLGEIAEVYPLEMLQADLDDMNPPIPGAKAEECCLHPTSHAAFHKDVEVLPAGWLDEWQFNRLQKAIFANRKSNEEMIPGYEG